MPKFRLLQKAPFSTAEGLAGVKLVTENEQQTRRLRQSFFFFGNGERKFVITGSAPVDGGEALDPVFDTCMKTFRFES